MASDGDIVDMMNMSSDMYPLLSPVKAKKSIVYNGPEEFHDFTDFNGELAVVCPEDEDTGAQTRVYLPDSGRVFTIGGQADKTKLVSLGNYLLAFPQRALIKENVSYFSGYHVINADSTQDYYEAIPAPTIVGKKILLVDYVTDSKDLAPEAPSAGERWTNCKRLYEYDGENWNFVQDARGYVYKISEFESIQTVKRKMWRDRVEGACIGYSASAADGSPGSTHIKVESDNVGKFNFLSLTAGETLYIYGSRYEGMNGAAEVAFVNETGSFMIITPPAGWFPPKTRWESSDVVYFETAMPILDCACAHNNRIWGASGSTIYASSLGDPSKFTTYSLSSTSAWTVDTAGGDFTACISYEDSVIFFKENEIYRVWGDTPNEFTFRKITCPGICPGDEKSVAYCGGYLYYLSGGKVMRYGGSYPVCVSESAGIKPFGSIITGGADLFKYYLCADDVMYVYDTRYNLWHKESVSIHEGTCFKMIGQTLYASFRDKDSRGRLCAVSGEADSAFLDSLGWMSIEDGDMPLSEVVFADIYEDTLRRKRYNALRLRVEVISGSVEVYISYDGGPRELVLTLMHEEANDKNIYQHELLPRRCDHFGLRIVGDGEYVIHAIDREYSVLSDK